MERKFAVFAEGKIFSKYAKLCKIMYGWDSKYSGLVISRYIRIFGKSNATDLILVRVYHLITSLKIQKGNTYETPNNH